MNATNTRPADHDLTASSPPAARSAPFASVASGAPSAPDRGRRGSDRDRIGQKFAEARRLAYFDPQQEDLYRRLWSLRATLAAEAGLPAYQILTNGQVLTLCERAPRDGATLTTSYGLSRVKVLAYGPLLLQVVQAAGYCDLRPEGNHST